MAHKLFLPKVLPLSSQSTESSAWIELYVAITNSCSEILTYHSRMGSYTSHKLLIFVKCHGLYGLWRIDVIFGTIFLRLAIVSESQREE